VNTETRTVAGEGSSKISDKYSALDKLEVEQELR